MPIKSFRGLMSDNAQERINLKHRDGRIGYRIVKFQAIPEDPGDSLGEHTVKIYKVVQAAVTSTINFSDETLLGVVSVSTHSANLLFNEVIIFDNEIFNQDIYITHTDRAASASCNYYIELEQMPIASDEATVATLKNMRNTSTP